MLTNIQFLRAFAALNVVLFHIIAAAETHGQPTSLLQSLVGWGANGVDIFFVVSGFIMVRVQRQTPRSPYDFLSRRIWRIVPDYWSLTLLLAALYAVAPGIFKSLDVHLDWLIASLFFVSALVFDGRMPVLYVGWTLEYEMLFYVVFAASLLIASVLAQRLVVFVVLLLLVALGLNLIVVEFLFGMGIAILLERVTVPRGVLVLAGLLGVAGLVASLFYHPQVDRVVVWGIPAALIVLAAAGLPQVRCAPLEYLGDASYDIYLVQVFVIPAFYRLSSMMSGSLPADVLAVFCLVATAAAGCVVYWLLNFFRKSWRPIAALRRPV